MLSIAAIMFSSYAAERNSENIKKQIADLNKEVKALTKRIYEIRKNLLTYDIIILHSDNPKNAFSIICPNRFKIGNYIDKQGKNIESALFACLTNPELLRGYLDTEKEAIKKLVVEYYALDKDIIAKEKQLDGLYMLLPQEFTPSNSPVYIR